MLKQYIVVIPAYEPDEKMIQLVKAIYNTTDFEILIVDDGSGEAYNQVFKAAMNYGKVLRHKENKGKGEAIKTALRFIQIHADENDGIITMDADGQHKLEDLFKVVRKLEEEPNALILGSRTFKSKVPFRSKIGNKLTEVIFNMVTQTHIQDTQTGLRGFSYEKIPFLLGIQGSRYEYEMNVLLGWAKNRMPIVEIPIETIYLEANCSSHFNVIRDSIKIYKELLQFSCVSLGSFCIDYSLFILVGQLTGNIILGNIIARIVSSSFNFLLNRQVVFRSQRDIRNEAIKYFTLVVILLSINTLLITSLVDGLRIKLYFAKIIVEIFLFIISFLIQKRIIFKSRRKGAIS